jgi:hypothetical protein
VGWFVGLALACGRKAEAEGGRGCPSPRARGLEPALCILDQTQLNGLGGV